MVYSSSYIYAKEIFNDSAYFLKKQLTFVFVGLIGAIVLSQIDFKKLFSYIKTTHIIITVLLAATFLPKLGISIKGARRWLDLGFVYIQPSEIIKYTISLFSIYYFNNFITFNIKNKILRSIPIITPLILFIFQPDFGSFSICLILISFVIFLSDFPRKYFYSFIGIAALGISFLVVMAPYRLMRLTSYIDPWKDPQKSGFQIIQSFLAFANGSLFGQGIGNSNEKLFYLPEAHNDFIFSVIAEELGFALGVLPVILLFLIALFFGFKISSNLKSKNASIVVNVIIFSIILQVALNMGVVLGLLPTKGLNLPLISYGGSSLVSNFLAIGLLISASKDRAISIPITKSSLKPDYACRFEDQVRNNK